MFKNICTGGKGEKTDGKDEKKIIKTIFRFFKIMYFLKGIGESSKHLSLTMDTVKNFDFHYISKRNKTISFYFKSILRFLQIIHKLIYIYTHTHKHKCTPFLIFKDSIHIFNILFTLLK